MRKNIFQEQTQKIFKKRKKHVCSRNQWSDWCQALLHTNTKLSNVFLKLKRKKKRKKREKNKKKQKGKNMEGGGIVRGVYCWFVFFFNHDPFFTFIIACIYVFLLFLFLFLLFAKSLGLFYFFDLTEFRDRNREVRERILFLGSHSKP